MPTKKKEEVVAEPVLKRYIAEIVLSKEPLQKDLYVGSYVYRDSTDTIVLEDANPGCASDLEGLMDGDISVVDSKGSTTMVSRHDQTLDWVKNLSLAKEFSGHPYYAGTPLEDTDTNETG